MTPNDFRYPEERVTRTLPKMLAVEDEKLFDAERFRHFDEVHAKTLSDITLLPSGISIRRTVSMRLYYGAKRISLRALLKLTLKTAKGLLKSVNTVRIDRALLITDHWSGGFFHWFSDVLQKLEALEKYNVDLSGYTVLIPVDFYHAFTRESLKVYNVQFRVIAADERALAAEAVYVPLITPSGNYRPDLMCSMRERFRRYRPSGTPTRRIYITRAQAKKRRVLNEDRLLPLLERLGFEIIVMEALPFWEQCRTIAEAEVLISLHGAGLTHMLWMQPGTKVMEIRSAGDTHNNCYFSLASDLGLAYYYLLADKADAGKSTQRADFMIDVDAAGEKIVHMLSDEITKEMP